VTRRRLRAPQLAISGNRRLKPYQRGQKRSDPILCGDPDTGQADRPTQARLGEPATLTYVTTTGMVHGLRAHTRAWVYGSGVAAAIDSGLFVEVEPPPEPVKIDRTPPVPPAAPDEQPKTPTIMCRDCTMTWRSGARVACTCDPQDQELWVILS
jgi:hypothetical protein